MAPLACAAESGDEKIVKLLLAKGPISVPKVIKGVYRYILQPRVAIMRLLLKQGAKVNSGNDLSHTPLSEAMHLGHGTIVKLLLG